LLPFSDPGVLPNVPSTIFTSPEVASIGLSEEKASAQYGSHNIAVYQRQLSHVDRAVCDSAQAGFVKIICLKKNNVIVGATIVAPVAGELIAEIAVLMRTKMPFDQVRRYRWMAQRFALHFLMLQFFPIARRLAASNGHASISGMKISS
jgi:pyruvate/2-oxoglutarate dehydrogenase complex dihydrolipoamide dehydrogenase (E3) component